MNSVQAISSFFQKIPYFRGKSRICKAILGITQLHKKKNIVIKTKHGKFELPNLVEIISLDLFVNGAYEKGLVRLLVKSIPHGGIFMDVGANIGSISIPLALSRPDIKIIAIEASPWIYKVLNSNIRHNNIKNIIAENYAVYYKSGEQLPMYAPQELFGKGSLKPLYTKESELVYTITIDDLVDKYHINKLDIIKVDVEGFEVCVFKGMNNFMGQEKPKIIFEFSEWAEKAAGFAAGEAQSALLSQGYALQSFDEQFNLVGEPGHSLFRGKDANLYAFKFINK